MRKFLFPLIVSLTGVLAVAGCGGGGGGGGGGGLPAADNVLPSELPDGTTEGIEDYLESGGTWRVNLDGQVRATAFGNANLANALNYDSDLDQWTINFDGTNLVLVNVGPSVGEFGVTDDYVSDCGTPPCALFEPFDDDPLTSQYGTFGYIAHLNNDLTALTEFFGHAGLKTTVANMPATGTGSYEGTFQGLVNSAIGFDYVEGSADITANFSSSGVTFASTGGGTFGTTYSLSGAATISGNTYDGTVSGSYTSGSTVFFSASGSTLSGAFYGPDQINVGGGETAGVVYTTNATDEFAGGFWAEQTVYIP